MVKHPPVNARDVGGDVGRDARRNAGLILGWGRSPAKGNGNPLKYSCLGNPRGARQAPVHGVTDWDSTEHVCTQCLFIWLHQILVAAHAIFFRHAESFTVVLGLSSCGARALECAGPVVVVHGLSCPAACGILVS